MIDVDRARALVGLLDGDPASLQFGDLLGPMWQVLFFLPRPAQQALGVDGHPEDDLSSPPRRTGMRRLFAGGRLWLTPGLRLGQAATARTAVIGTRDTVGGNGPMTFVTTRTTVLSEGRQCLVEERDLVYLEAVAGAPPPQPPAEAAGSHSGVTHEVDIRLLFRFSALTYNAHRIHYDRDYAREVEGYPGLVVHGPLQALLMAESARASLDGDGVRRAPATRTFEYQLVAPLFEQQGLRVESRAISAATASATVTDRSGRVTARGQLTYDVDRDA